MRRILFMIAILAMATPCFGQESFDATAYEATTVNESLEANRTEVEDVQAIEVNRRRFARQLTRAAYRVARRGNNPDVTVAKVADMDVALKYSPAFRQKAELVALVQMKFSGQDLPADLVPTSGDGRLRRSGINWEGLAAFLERLVPIILMLLESL